VTIAEVPDADLIAAAALRQPAVVSLHGGQYGEVATYLPGRRVIGVQVEGGRVAVHLRVRFGPPLLPIAAAVRAAVTPLAHGLPVDIVVGDVVSDSELAARPVSAVPAVAAAPSQDGAGRLAAQ
jgi:hypothetical protein